MRTAEDILREKDSNEIISVPIDSTIHDALKVMLERRIGAIIVKDGDQHVGIWTERDLMKNTVSEGFDAKTAKIGDFMVKPLLSAPLSATVYQLLDKFLGRRLRHLLIEKDGKYVGLLSTGDVVKADLIDKSEEINELSTILNWEYYDNWSPRKK